MNDLMSGTAVTANNERKLISRPTLKRIMLGLTAAGLLAAAAQAMLLITDNKIRLSPVTISIQSAVSLSAQDQATEKQTVGFLFDRDTTTAHTAYDVDSVDIKLEKLTDISSVRFYGAAEMVVAVQALQGGSWNTIPGLDQIKLSGVSQSWNSYAASQSVSTDSLRFVLTPTTKKTGGNPKTKTLATASTASNELKEIEIWGSGSHTLIPPTLNQNATTLMAAMNSKPAPAQTRQLIATPAEGVVSNTGQSFKFTLNQPAANFKRAWLSYETFGVAHWVSPVRRINGETALGGGFIFAGNDWTQQAEPIHPNWLVQGSNKVEFSLPTGVPGTYSVRNVRLLLELDDGNNFIYSATTTQNNVENDTPALIDGDLATGWSPYNTRYKSDKPALTLYFDKPTQLDTLSLNLANTLTGTMGVDILVAGQWQNAGLPTVNVKKLSAGWNNLTGFAPLPATALRLNFQNGAGSTAEVRDITVSGSGTGPAFVPAINVAYPDAGQFYGRQAYIRGFLSVTDNGSGPAALSIAGRKISSSDGSFGELVSKEDAGYGKQADAEAWQVTIDALYPDGQKLTKIVKLTQYNDASKAHGLLPSRVNPGFAALIVLGDASLELGPDATDEGINIKITPLSEKDLPRLDPGMTNVTRGPYKGYRFTPSPYKFKKNIKVTLPFDAAFVPRGHVEDDIKTYYFDTQAGHWVPLDRVLVDSGKKRITSLTNHFTDMINATLTVPDHPEAVSFNPTQIKDIKAADPGAGINLIEPPQANNTGDARLSYPIEIPQGRQGMQPQLAISYNSAGGNGWLGQGWDLSVPSISIETRWGVPRYDATSESETYVLNGEQLVPLVDGKPGTMPHRAAWDKLQTRVTDKQYFVSRVEGAFRRIIRHGDKPTEYWWEVIDKNGVKNFYGGVDKDDISGKLGGEKGIFKWMLKRTQDTNGNYVEYNYDKVCDTGTGTGVCNIENYVNGYQLYLSDIGYTRKGIETAPYTISFIREAARRTDINIDARGGFKQVTATRLGQIDIKYGDKYDGKLIRRYKTQYRYGTFAKSLLTAIIQSDSNGEEFNRHAFDYYNDMSYDAATQSYAGFAGGVEWDALKDGVKLKLAGIDFESSLVGANLGHSEGSSGMIGLAFGSPENAIGVSFSSNSSDSTGVLQMMDVDGDGLPDKVYQKEGKDGVYYRRNTWVAGQAFDKAVIFGAEKPLTGLEGISHSNSGSSSFGIDGRFGGGVGYYGSGDSLNNDKLHLADINGDGLIDMVTESGEVKFGSFQIDSLPTGEIATPDLINDNLSFVASSSLTTSKINTAGNPAQGMLPNLTTTYGKLLNRNPLLDVVKRWEAPWGGMVQISGTVMLKDTAAARTKAKYKTADGVTVNIEKNGSVLWTRIIPIEDAGKPFDTQTLPAFRVERKDRLYFRVKSRFDGKYDEVVWTPRVTYIDANPATLLDVNNRDVYRYDAAEDFTLAGRIIEIPVTYRGKVRFGGILKKLAQTTDDVKFELTVIKHKKDPADENKVVEASRQTMLVKHWRAAEISEFDFEKANPTGDLPLFPELAVEKGDSLVLRFRSDSNIDIQNLDWINPRLYYTEAWNEGGSYTMPTQVTPAPTVGDSTTGGALKPGSTSNPQSTLPPGPITPLEDDKGPIYNLPTSYNIDTYPLAWTDSQNREELSQPQRGWVAPRDGVLVMTPWVSLKTYAMGNRQLVQASDGDIAFTVKRRGMLLDKGVIKVRNLQLQGNGYDNLKLLQVSKGDELFFDISVRDSIEPTAAPLKEEIAKAEFRVHYAGDIAWTAPFSDNVNVTSELNAYGLQNEAVPGTNLTLFGKTLPEGTELPTGKIIFVVRQGAVIIERKEFAAKPDLNAYAMEMSLPVKADEKYNFEIFTASKTAEIQDATVWTRYPGAEPWIPPADGAIELHPKLTFKPGSVSSGTFILRAINTANNTELKKQEYSVSNGIVNDSGTPMSINVNAGVAVRFEYTTNYHLLSTDLAQRPQIRMDYANKIVWKVPSTWFGLFGAKDIDVTPQPVFDFAGNSVNGSINFAIWRGADKLAQTTLSVNNGQLTIPATPLRVSVGSGDELNFVFSSSALELTPYLKSQTASVQLVGNTIAPVSAPATFNFLGLTTEASALHILMPHLVARQDPQSSVLHFSEDRLEFPLPYRGWTVAGYNGNSDSCLQKHKLNPQDTCTEDTEAAIDESKLLMDTSKESFNRTRVETIYLAVPETTINLFPNYKHWRTIDPQWSVQADSMTSSRMGGVDYVYIPQASEFAKEGVAMRVPRLATADFTNWGGGYVVVANFGKTDPSQGVLDMLDLNGDRYPDVMGTSGILYSLPDGALDNDHAKAAVGAVREGVTDTFNLSQGPSRPEDDTSDKGQNSKSNPPTGKNQSSQRSDLDLTGSFGMTFTNSKYDMMDVNGDGLPDRVTQENGHLKVALNLGYGFALAEEWGGEATITQSGGMNVSAGFSYPLKKFPPKPDSTPSGSFSGGMSLSGDISNTTKQMADINGDGLPDNVYNSDGKLFVGFNTGSGFLEAKEWTGSLNGLRDSTSEGRNFSLSANVSASIYIPFPILTIAGINITFGHNWSDSIAPQQVGLRDMNGDGLPDSIKSENESTVSVALNQTGKTNLLKEVRRPLGARFDIDYVRTGNTYAQPQSKYVMSEVRVFDGVADDTPGAYKPQGSDWQRNTYAYDNGEYDRFERDFLGYQTVTSIQHDTRGKNGANLTAKDLGNTPAFRKTVQEYSNSHVYSKGLLLRETLFDASSGSDKPYIETVNTYDFWKFGDSPTTATDPLQLNRFSERATAVLFPRLIGTSKAYYEGLPQPGQSSYTTYVYDELGNVTHFTEGGSGVEEVRATIDYENCPDNPDSYIVGKPKVISVKTSAGEVRRREGDFDCTTGTLTKQRAFIDTGRFAETKFFWDGYGNLASIEGPAGSGGALKLSYTYDRKTQTYPVDIFNESYILHSTASYDEGTDNTGLYYGKPLSTFDTNGQEIRYHYDSNGRTEWVRGPQEKANDHDWTIHFTYAPYLNTDPAVATQASYALTQHADRAFSNSGVPSYQADTIDTVLFTDGTKRVLQTKKDASVSAGKGAAAQNMMIISGRVAVDALGRAIAQYYPTAQTTSSIKGGSDLSFIKDEDKSANPTVTDYDVLDRATSTTLPDGTTTTMEYGFGRDAFERPSFSTIVTDANFNATGIGSVKKSYRNVRELITTVVEENRTFDKAGNAVAGGKTQIATKYIYDPLKQITQVIDFKGNTTNVEYDNLGRRTVIENPDTGKTITEYDLASNPVKKITAKLGAANPIEYDYEFSRLTHIRHPLYKDADVTYTYGTASDSTLNQAGRVKSVTHQSGIEVREYGRLGEVVKETLTLTAAANGGSNPPVYTTQYDFDSFGRLHKLTLPDNEIIVNHYDSGGNLNNVSGTLNGRPYQYLERLDYDEFESRIYLKVGNGVVTEYSYDPKNRRLANLKAGSPGKNAMQDIAYGYDAVGNISSLNDTAPIPKTNEYGGKLEQSFHYDDLYRLVKADGVYTTAREIQRYEFAMAYDEIHNITHKTQKHTVEKIGGTPRIEAATTYDWDYRYPAAGSARPHAPIHIGERSFEYDANGNQSGWLNDSNGTRRTIVWDEENRIREVQDPKHGASFSYDDQGERKLKKSQYGEVAYINQFFTVRNGAIASTHVYAGTSRIVTKVGAGTPVGKVANLKGTGNLNPNAPTGGDIVVTDTFAAGTGTTTAPTPATGTTNTPSPLAGEGRGEGASRTTATTATSSGFPGQGIAHRSDRANEVAQNTLKNPNLNGGIPGGEHGAGNSNAGGNGNAAGTSNNPGNTGNTGGGNSGGGVGGGSGSGNGGSTGGGGAGQGNGREFIFFYHPDHLGSTGYVTDEKALRYEHITYFPFGETWVQESNATWRVPYQFTSKEMDQETGLYYFGARYYDPRTSVWQSVDPILDNYLDGKPNAGVYGPPNLALYSYAHNEPVRLSDPDGRWVNIAIGAGIGAVLGAGIEGWKQVATGDFNAGRLGAAAAGGAVAGGIAGATMGLSLIAEGGAAATVGVVGASSAAGGSTTRALMGEKVSPGTVATDAAVGVATAGLLKGAGAVAGSIRNVNAVGGNMNCVNCAIATDATLAGRPASAMSGGPTQISALEKIYGAKFGSSGSIGDVEGAMSAAGSGSRGIVFGSRGNEVGHVFNVANQNGNVRFLDGQTGGAASTEGYNSFRLLRTDQ